MPTATRQLPILLTLHWPHSLRQRTVKAVHRATVTHVLVAVALLILLCGVSEDWWVSAALSYLPRAPYLVFSLAIIPALLCRQWLYAGVNLLCGALIAGPVMGLCVPLSSVTAPTPDSLLVLSCNIQNGDSDLPELLAEIDTQQPDVIAFQEVQRGEDVLAKHFAGWHTLHIDEYYVASRFPIRLLGEHHSKTTDRTTAIACEVAAPSGAWRLCDIHLSTARHGLTKLRWHSPVSRVGIRDLEWQQWERRLEAEETLHFIDDHAGLPLLVAGDFNTPTTSSLFSDVWTGWQSAFETAGTGYGYTSPCNSGRLWPRNTPWLRIDHILCDSSWQIHSVGIGHTDGSDHRLIWSRVSLPLDRARIQDSGFRIQGKQNAPSTTARQGVHREGEAPAEPPGRSTTSS
ncbi:MAG: endonuclease/exonuclease/phosphatase family protein [Planctomycetaceae bacterium]